MQLLGWGQQDTFSVDVSGVRVCSLPEGGPAATGFQRHWKASQIQFPITSSVSSPLALIRGTISPAAPVCGHLAHSRHRAGQLFLIESK